ncbi:MAG TPA: hypothetical protein VKH61_17295 [Streptosporangiaceae bacterium]|nr:hypothetical protein [Streptosporangiaceae bacterium]
MTDQPTQTAPAARELDERVSRLEQAIDIIKAAVTGVHKDSTAATEARLDAPGSIAEEVQRELDRRDQATVQAQKEAEFEQVKAVVLAEKQPLPPPRKIERLMGWHG